MRSVILLAGATAAVALGMAVPPVAAGAAPSPAPTSSRRNCVVHLSSGGAMTCYGTFTEAIADATGGRIADAPRDAAQALAGTAFNDRVDALAEGRAAGQKADTVIEISYEHKDFLGASLTWETASGCDNSGDIDWEAKEITGDWNDQISSFRTYARCQGKHYEDVNFGGASTESLGTTAWIGTAMNDRTSSIRWI